MIFKAVDGSLIHTAAFHNCGARLGPLDWIPMVGGDCVLYLPFRGLLMIFVCSLTLVDHRLYTSCVNSDGLVALVAQLMLDCSR